MRANEVKLVEAARQYMDGLEHFYAVTGPQAIAEGVCALTGCEMTDDLIRKAELGLRAECAESRLAVEQALKEVLRHWVGVALP